MGKRHPPIMLEKALPDALRHIAEPESERLRVILRQVEAHAELAAKKRPTRWLPLLLLGTAVSAAALIGYQQLREQEEGLPVSGTPVPSPILPKDVPSTPAQPAVVTVQQQDDKTSREKASGRAQQPSHPNLIYLR